MSDILPRSDKEIIDADNLMILFKQHINEVTSDESGSSSY